MPGMIAPLVHLSSRPDLEMTRLADALSDGMRAGSNIQFCSLFSDGIQETVPASLSRTFTPPNAFASTVQAPAQIYA